MIKAVSIKQKTCRVCKVPFSPFNSLTRVCSIQCARKFASEQTNKQIRKENHKKLNDIKPKSVHLKELQVIFNSFIRGRDKGKPCISCQTISNRQLHAGHFYSVGAYPNLRFNEDNVHQQCQRCNTELHGNIQEYSIHLPNRIGEERYRELGNQRRQPLQLSIPEIIGLKEVYKLKIKALCEEQG